MKVTIETSEFRYDGGDYPRAIIHAREGTEVSAVSVSNDEICCVSISSPTFGSDPSTALDVYLPRGEARGLAEAILAALDEAGETS